MKFYICILYLASVIIITFIFWSFHQTGDAVASIRKYNIGGMTILNLTYQWNFLGKSYFSLTLSKLSPCLGNLDSYILSS